MEEQRGLCNTLSNNIAFQALLVHTLIIERMIDFRHQKSNETRSLRGVW